MRTYRGWLPGAVQQRAEFVKPRARPSEREQRVADAQLDAIDADIQRRAAEDIERQRARLRRIDALVGRTERGSGRRKALFRMRAAARAEIGSLEDLVGTGLPETEHLPRYIERHGLGYRAKLSRTVYGRVYSERSETHATVRAAVAAIGAVRKRLEKITKAARRQAEAERRTA